MPIHYLFGLLVEEHGESEDGGALVEAPGKVLPVLVEAGGHAADVLRGVVVRLDQLGRVREDPVDSRKHVLQSGKGLVRNSSFLTFAWIEPCLACSILTL